MAEAGRQLKGALVEREVLDAPDAQAQEEPHDAFHVAGLHRALVDLHPEHRDHLGEEQGRPDELDAVLQPAVHQIVDARVRLLGDEPVDKDAGVHADRHRLPQALPRFFNPAGYVQVAVFLG